MDYTVEVYKLDKRVKGGMVLVDKKDYTGVKFLAQVEAMHPRRPRYIIQIHETYVTRRNAMTGVEFQERYDTPWSCSPASETYWSA
jgi:hypothetical protein